MYRTLAFSFLTLLSQGAFAQSSPAIDLKNQASEARSCVKGFSTASQMLGKDRYKGPDNVMALSLVKTLCASDSLVVSFYSAQRNSKNAKPLDEIKSSVEDMIVNWFTEDVEVLQAAEKTANQ
ncbi:hypothetical protein RVM24_07035 [Marinobacter sp. KM021]|uniref:hypothetical protein n=1 Tax=Marinobacter TaxID=2742 RepID=UPI001E2EA9D8|nr:hypothetical protein [Marinobacter shengliensis]MCD1630341.1 hypothetical protein [Marinobacter shengliensis]